MALSLILATTGCASIQNLIDPDWLEIQDIHSKVSEDGKGMHYWEVKEYRRFSGMKKETKEGIIFCKIDPKVTMGHLFKVFYRADINGGRAGLINIEDKATFKKRRSGSPTYIGIHIKTLRDKCLASSKELAQKHKRIAIKEIQAQQQAQRKKNRLKAIKEEQGTRASVQEWVDEYKKRKGIKHKVKHANDFYSFATAVTAIRKRDIAKNDIIAVVTFGGTYRVAQPIKGGYRLTMETEYSRWKPTIRHLPILLKTKKEFFEGEIPTSVIDLIKYDGLTNYTTVSGAATQALAFTDLDD
mgnify:CR=1 FL=1